MNNGLKECLEYLHNTHIQIALSILFYLIVNCFFLAVLHEEEYWRITNFHNVLLGCCSFYFVCMLVDHVRFCQTVQYIILDLVN